MKTYQRYIDNGAGVQTVVVDGSDKIVAQTIAARHDLHHSYTGDGNPEWIGLDKKELRGKGFEKLRGTAHDSALELYFQD